MKKMETFWFTHVIKKSNLTTKELDDLFMAGCRDATFTTRNGKLYVSFARKAKSLEESIRSSIEEIKSVLKKFKIEDTIIEQEKGDCGIIESIASKAALAKLQKYASHIKGNDSRFYFTSYIVLEDGGHIISRSSFLVKLETENDKWIGLISEHQLPQVFHQEEVIFYDNFNSEVIEQI